ncbi:MAG: aldehyde ferredoxin oxidoreductase N-terminal domain-containing protein [Nitrososphaeria archaeon]
MTTLYGYVGKILRINLSTNKISFTETSKYSKMYIGGRGIAARIAWEELKPGISPYSPENKLIFMSGPLTGVLSPGSGRISVSGIAPQVYPKPWYTRSNMGGRFGSWLKYAGFDGIVIEGKSDKPVYVWIYDDKHIDIMSAESFWGIDTFSMQKKLQEKHGETTISACIGIAGENLVNTATIITDAGNAAGQGGFGAVMGSKKLKAIAITIPKTGLQEKRIAIADPEQLIRLWKRCQTLLQGGPKEPTLISEYIGTKLEYSPKYYACSQACPGLCDSHYFQNIPSKHFQEILSTHMMCVGSIIVNYFTGEKAWAKVNYKIGIPEALKINKVSDQLGLNQWDLIGGLFLWLAMCYQKGILSKEEIGIEIDPNDPDCWMKLMNMIAYKNGFGKVLAEGTMAAAEKLGKGFEYLPYVAYGYAEHGAGRCMWGWFEYPYWIVGALLWATDTRDPFSDTGHAYSHLIRGGHYAPVLDQDKIKQIAKYLWGSDKTVSDDYEDKAQVAIWLQNRGCLISSLPVCDWSFPIVTSKYTPDNFGDTSMESRIYSAVTGINMSEKELDKVGERIFNLERSIAVREGRKRGVDETVGKFFEKPDWTRKITMPFEKFKTLLLEYYKLRGWTEEGVPTKSKLMELGLDDVFYELEKFINR